MIEPFWWWTDEQKAFAKDVDEFVDSHIQLAEEAYWEKRFPWAVMEEVAEKGYMGAGVSKEYGGLELGAIGSCIVAEGLGRLYAVGHVFVVSMLGGLHQLVIFGTDSQKAKYLRQISEGKVLGAVCITEPFAGSDAANVYTTATKAPVHEQIVVPFVIVDERSFDGFVVGQRMNRRVRHDAFSGGWIELNQLYPAPKRTEREP